MKKTLTLMLSLALSLSALAQDLQSQAWPAKWISVPGASELDYGVYYFRKNVDLAAVPARYLVHVTGDNRYKLYVNETLVSMGPAKGDALHWNYETVDLAPYLNGGRNVIAALVYNEGSKRPDSQISVRTGFLLQGEAESAEVYTDTSWICIQDSSFSPVTPIVNGYYVAGPGEKVDMNLALSDWNKADADLSAWKRAQEGIRRILTTTCCGHPPFPRWKGRLSPWADTLRSLLIRRKRFFLIIRCLPMLTST